MNKYCLFLGTRTRMRHLEIVGFLEKPKIFIDRNVQLDAILLKRKRIVNRRATLAESMETIPEPEINSDELHQPSGRMVFAVGRPTKGFRSILNRRSSAPATRTRQMPPIELFDAPIIKNDDDNGDCIPIRFDDINFGRLED